MSFIGATGGAAAIASAFVAIRPDGSNFSSELDSELRPGLRGAAERIKESMQNAGEEGGSKLAAGFGAAAREIQEHALVVGAAFSAAGLGLETWARSQQDANVSLGRLSTTTGIAEGDLRSLVGELDNVTFSTDEVIAVLGNASAQGIRTGEDMAHFARTWDLVADATGESVVALSDAGVALRALDIDDPAEALDAFGFIATETTSSVGEFLEFVGRMGPELRDLNLDVDDTAAIMGVLERELGMTGRTARSEFRSAVSEADGDLGLLLDTLGVSPASFAAMRAEVEGSGEALERNAELYAESFTPLQRLQSWVGETAFQFGGMANAAGIAGGALTAMGPALMAVSQAGPAMGALAGGVGRVRGAMVALRTVMAAHPIMTFAVVAGGVVAAFGLLRGGSDETAERIDNLARAMRDAESAADGLMSVILGAADDTPIFRAALVETGITAEELSAAFLEGEDATTALAEQLRQGAIDAGYSALAADMLAESIIDQADATAEAIVKNEEHGVISQRNAEDLDGLAAAHIANAEGMREALIATEDLTEAFDEQAVQAAANEAAMAVMEAAFAEVEEAADALQGRVDSAMQAGARSINRFSEEGKSDLGSFVSELQSNVESLTEWQNNLTTIAERGSAEFALEMAEFGPEFSGMIAGLADATDEEFAATMAAMTAMTEATQRDMAGEFAEIDPAFKKTLQGVAGMTQLEMIIIEMQASQQAFAVGQAMTSGMEAGVSAAAGRVAAAAAQVVRDAVDAAKREGDMRSPSRLFAREVGAPIAQGVAVGIEAESRLVEDAIAGLIAAPGVDSDTTFSASAGSTGGAGGAARGGVTIVNNGRNLSPSDVSQAIIMAELIA